MTLRTLIVDDEDLARQVVREYCAAMPEIEVVGECTNGFDAVKAVHDFRPDLLFLDVQMPKLDGFEVLELIPPGPAIVFVTAYDQYATKAFDAAAIDYLLKPFDEPRFRKAVTRVLQHQAPLDIPTLKRAAAPPERFAERVVVKDGARVHVIPVQQLEFAEAQEDYVALNSGGKTYLKQQPISALEESLNPAQFVRVHRSYLVNLDLVSKIEPYTKDTRVAVLKTGAQIPISRAGYLRLRQAMGQD